MTSPCTTTSDITLYLRNRIVELHTQGHHGTARKYATLLSNLRAYLGRRPWPLGSTSRLLIQAFADYLLSRGITRNTLSSYLRPLRALLRRAWRDDLLVYDNRWFADVYTGIDTTSKRAISDNDLKAVFTLDLAASPRLALARDALRFSFHARGMAFVDLAHLTSGNISDGRLVYARHKTGQLLNIAIDPVMRAILHRYADTGSPYLFPFLRGTSGYESALRCYNYHLRQISRKALCSRTISSYAIRHTWATRAIRMHVPVSVISAGMGHTSERTTRIYLDTIFDPRIDEANTLVTDLG